LCPRLIARPTGRCVRYRWLCGLSSTVVGAGPEQLCGELFGVFGGDGVVADSGQGADRRIRQPRSDASFEGDNVMNLAAFGEQDADRYS